MRNIMFAIFGFISVSAYAAAPATTCPAGYTTVNQSDIMLGSGTTCPAGYVAAGTVASCLATSLTGDCMMYAPMGVLYDDATGSYQWNVDCPLTD